LTIDEEKKKKIRKINLRIFHIIINSGSFFYLPEYNNDNIENFSISYSSFRRDFMTSNFDKERSDNISAVIKNPNLNTIILNRFENNIRRTAFSKKKQIFIPILIIISSPPAFKNLNFTDSNPDGIPDEFWNRISRDFFNNFSDGIDEFSQLLIYLSPYFIYLDDFLP
jgi:hypothetical protein